MALDLAIPTEVIACPTIREPDGLAMSSRNVHLKPDERAAAAVLRRALLDAREAWERPAMAGQWLYYQAYRLGGYPAVGGLSRCASRSPSGCWPPTCCIGAPAGTDADLDRDCLRRV
jgi:hypothetical protein